jgi:hypothetical protein
MNQLFKKTGNNNFQLLTENVNTQPKTHEVIQLNNGLKKIFCEGVDEISYNKVQNMGFGFIKDIHSAKLVALEESRIIAEEFGYRDDVDNAKFVKEEQWNTGDFDTPEQIETKEEKREVQIGKEILNVINSAGMDRVMETEKGQLRQLANELIQMHGAK